MINDNSQFEKYFQMKNGNKSPIKNGNENLIRKWKAIKMWEIWEMMDYTTWKWKWNSI